MTRRVRRARRRSFKVKRHYLPGTPIEATPGVYLEVAVLFAHGPEIFGVDLASGAFVRVETVDTGGPIADATNRSDLALAGTVVGFEVFEEEPVDPGRPEAVWTKGSPESIGKLRRLQFRRLLRAVVAPEHLGGLVLGTRASSVAYTDIEPAKPSIMLITLRARHCRLSTNDEARAMLGFTWGGLRQSLELADPVAIGIERGLPQTLRGDALNRFLGFKVRYVLVANLPVEGGYVRKSVLALFPD